MTFDTSFDRLIGNEGGYVNRPDDPGGETQWGITWPILHQAIGRGLLPPETTIASLTRDQARVVYLNLFWNDQRMDSLPPAIAYQVFDAAVNHGPANAVRWLQRAVGVADDGSIGAVTIAAVGAVSVPVALSLFHAERLEFYTKLSTWASFGKGWANRIVADLRYAAKDEA